MRIQDQGNRSFSGESRTKATGTPFADDRRNVRSSKRSGDIDCLVNLPVMHVWGTNREEGERQK